MPAPWGVAALFLGFVLSGPNPTDRGVPPVQVQHKQVQNPDPMIAATTGGRSLEQNGLELFPIQALKVLGRKEDAGQQTRTRGTAPGAGPPSGGRPHALCGGRQRGRNNRHSPAAGSEQGGQGRLPFLLLV